VVASFQVLKALKLGTFDISVHFSTNYPVRAVINMRVKISIHFKTFVILV
jgi:hypothetical protein